MIGNLFVQKKSVVHELDFWTKFICFLLVFPLVSFMASPKIVLLGLLLLISLLALSRIGFAKFWQATKIYFIPLSIGIIILSVLFSSDGIREGIILVMRFGTLISFGVLFAMTTNPIEIPGGFLRVHLPHKFGITLMVGYRMMPLISQKIATVIDAQRARGAQISFSIKTLPKLPVIASSLLVPILHSTLETSVRLSDTLISRGYDPDAKITVAPTRIRLADYILMAVTVLAAFFSLWR